MAARSPEPANRCARPHALSASAAGRRSASIAATTSMAADRRAAGVMPRDLAFSRSLYKEKRAPASWQPGEDAHHEDHPHDQEHRETDPEQRPALADIVAGRVHIGVGKARQHEDPG